jgi:serine/threonine protein kinase
VEHAADRARPELVPSANWDASGDLLRGTVIDERYFVEACAGRGGVATVYKCRHMSLDTIHAVKVLRYLSPGVARRLMAEGRAQAALQHPNIVRVTDSVEVDGAPALVMEYVPGPSLDELIPDAPLSQDQLDDLARGLFAGVAAAHAFGVVHRDLKPSNVLLDLSLARPIPKIADFGLVKVLDADARATHRTRQGVAMGTPEYMAPEQIRSARDVDYRADVFSLGAILYELVTGTRCFQADDVLDLFNRIARGVYRPIIELAPHAPRRVIRAINAALEPDRERRCPTVAALAELWFDGVQEPDHDVWSRGPWRDAVAAWKERERMPVAPDRSTFPPMETAVPSARRPSAPPTAVSWVEPASEARQWQIAGVAASAVTVLVGLLALLALQTGVAPVVVSPAVAAPPAPSVEEAPPVARPPVRPEVRPEPVPAIETEKVKKPILKRRRARDAEDGEFASRESERGRSVR